MHNRAGTDYHPVPYQYVDYKQHAWLIQPLILLRILSIYYECFSWCRGCNFLHLSLNSSTRAVRDPQASGFSHILSHIWVQDDAKTRNLQIFVESRISTEIPTWQLTSSHYTAKQFCLHIFLSVGLSLLIWKACFEFFHCLHCIRLLELIEKQAFWSGQ